MRYYDTSVLVAALTRERFTAAAQRSLADPVADRFMISAWTSTEVSAALSSKVRSGELSVAQRATVWDAYTALRRTTLTTVPVSSGHFTSAARLARSFVILNR